MMRFLPGNWPNFTALIFFTFGPQSVLAEPDIEWQTKLIETSGFILTVADLAQYLQIDNAAQPELAEWGSVNRIKEGLDQLYALNNLRGDAEAAIEMSAEEREWIAEYNITMTLVTRYLADTLEARLQDVDWEVLAKEQYLANKTEYVQPESRSLRTLLIRTDCRSESEAIAKAERILSYVESSSEAFEAAVTEHTEDRAAVETGGLMQNVVRGQTVPEFEAALFALASAGDLSAPVVSQYGVHLIELLEITEARQRTFEEVRPEIVSLLEESVSADILATLRMEARERRPEGLAVKDAAIDELARIANQ